MRRMRRMNCRRLILAGRGRRRPIIDLLMLSTALPLAIQSPSVVLLAHWQSLVVSLKTHTVHEMEGKRENLKDIAAGRRQMQLFVSVIIYIRWPLAEFDDEKCCRCTPRRSMKSAMDTTLHRSEAQKCGRMAPAHPPEYTPVIYVADYSCCAPQNTTWPMN